MNEKIEMEVLRHLHVQVLGGGMCRVYEDDHILIEADGADAPVIVPTPEAAIVELSRRLDVAPAPAAAAPEPAPPVRRRTLDELVVEAKRLGLDKASVEEVAKALRIKPTTAAKVLDLAWPVVPVE